MLAINRTAATNASGRTADFVELRNTNAVPFNLTGARLGTSADNNSQWIFPAGTTVPANGYLAVWFDDERPASTNAESVLNTGRSIDGESDEVWLFNSVGQPVDSVTFGFQVVDQPIGRTGASWSLLASATPGANNAAVSTLGASSALRVNEWMTDPVTGGDWFELYNGGNQPVSMAGLFLSDTLSIQGLTQFEIAPLSFIGARGFVKWLADGDPGQGRNHASFNLDGEGEALQLSTGSAVIDAVSFGLQTAGVSQGRLPDSADNFASFPGAATPSGSNFLPHPAVVINEVLTHTDAPLEDAIEIYNRSGQGIDLSGWFLSDSAGDFKKFRIPDGTFLAGGGYRVFYQAQFDSGAAGGFSLDSSHGDQVILSESDAAGNLSGYRAQVSFGAAANGVSFGRHESCNGVDFVPQSQRTFGSDAPVTLSQFRIGPGTFNAAPKVGPVVINEIMYHPAGLGTNDNVLDEYLELHNISGASVNLYDTANPANIWRVRGGISFNLPAGFAIPAGGFVLLVNFDPVASPAQLASFRALFNVPVGVPVLGPYSGKLGNGGERVELLQPDVPQPGTGFVPYVLVDHVEYGDGAPWPSGGDGDGASLQRNMAGDFGNDASNWSAAGPTAGQANPVQLATGPSIVTQPVSRAVSAVSGVVFSVSVCGTRPLAYQWKFNGANISGATNASFVLVTALAGGSGNYTVLVSTAWAAC